MPPTAKDLDVATASPQSTASQAGSGKAQPVAMEVPVTVNGARTVEGSDKREPFSETTQTVLVFGNGAVIRLASSVAPGQLLFLTNEKTKKEVVCQVLKSKNYSTVSGYVELEFTENVPGFWGIRFAPEASTKPAAPAPASVKPSVVAPPPAAPFQPAQPPAASALPKSPTPPTPIKTEPVTTSALKAEPKPQVTLPRAGEPVPPTTLPKAPAGPNSFGTGVTSSVRPPEIKPAPVAAKAPSATVTPTPSAPVHTPPVHPASEAIRRESARLQEQLSTLNFGSQAPAANKPATSEPPGKIIEMAKPLAAVPKVASPTPLTPNTSNKGLDSEEVKIPSWLEPLARNVATPSQNEAAADEVAAEIDSLVEFEVQDVSAPATKQEIAADTPVAPALESDFAAASDVAVRPQVSSGNKKIMMIAGIAAGFLVLVAGGTWLARRSSGPAVQTASAAVEASAAPATQPSNRAAETSINNNAGSANLASNSSQPANQQSLTPSAQPLKSASLEKGAAAAELSAYKKLAEPQPQPVVQPQTKKPILGQVHLAAPAAARRPTASEAAPADLAPSLGAGQIAPTGDALGGSLATGANKTVAPPTPLAVGGNVKQAKLISSTQPIYPLLAKSQHVEGNVRVDALVDEKGHVSSMKVVSGPTLLHQAAMDAIRQWKYEPATLDGKPVSMHLTVTLQFRLQ